MPFNAGMRIDMQGVNDVIRLVSSATLTSYQVGEFEKFIFVDTTAHAFAVYLPPVGGSAGRKIVVTNKGADTLTTYPFTGAATGTNAADSKIYDGAAAQVSQALTDANSFTSLYCDGEKWIADAFDLTI